MSDARERLTETMARRGMTDNEWEAQPFGYIKVQRATAAEMFDALLASRDDLIEALGGENVGWLNSGKLHRESDFPVSATGTRTSSGPLERVYVFPREVVGE